MSEEKELGWEDYLAKTIKAFRAEVHEGGPKGLLPEEFWKHRRAAKKEMLLAWRSLLDTAIERLEKEPEKKKEAKKIAVH
jgi:hypothetical protein